jgi:hypothetical protein
MNRRFRPFYVAAIAVVMVGLYGTEVVPKSPRTAVPENVSVQPAVATADEPGWLGPEETSPSGLLNFTSSLSILPFDVAH